MVRNGKVQFGERFPIDADMEHFASDLLAAADMLVTTVRQTVAPLVAAGIRFDTTFIKESTLSVENQWVELAWRYGDTLVFARLRRGGHPYVIAWVEYEE